MGRAMGRREEEGKKGKEMEGKGKGKEGREVKENRNGREKGRMKG